MQKIDKLKNQEYEDESENNKKINTHIEQLKLWFGLQRIPDDKVDSYLDTAKEFLGSHYYAEKSTEKFLNKENPVFRADIAIIMHMLFKKSNKKQQAISSAEYAEKKTYLPVQMSPREKQSLAEHGVKEIKFAANDQQKKALINAMQHDQQLKLTPLEPLDQTKEQAFQEQQEKKREIFRNQQKEKRKAFKQQQKPFWTKVLEWLRGTK